MNYSELVEAIESTTENTFETDDMDRFIRLAEQRVYNTGLLASTRKNVTGAVTAGNQYLSTPSDFLASFSLAVIDSSGVYSYLLNKDPDFIREAFPDPSATGLPTQYGLFDADTFILGPTPDQAYEVELHYFAYPESIVTAGTTWLGTNFDSVLLNAALVEAARFMKEEEDVVGLYEDQYKKSIALLMNLANGKTQQDMYRSGTPRTKVV